MLKTKPIQHFINDLNKRWMCDDFFELVIWYDGEGTVYGFQLSYDRFGYERALTWTREGGYRHSAVNTVSGGMGFDASPILTQEVEFCFEKIHREFLVRVQQLDPAIRDFVESHLVEYGCTPRSNVSE